MDIHQKGSTFFFIPAIAMPSLFTYSVYDEKIKTPVFLLKKKVNDLFIMHHLKSEINVRSLAKSSVHITQLQDRASLS